MSITMNRKKAHRILDDIVYWLIAVWLSIGVACVLLGNMYIILKIIIDLTYC